MCLRWFDLSRLSQEYLTVCVCRSHRYRGQTHVCEENPKPQFKIAMRTKKVRCAYSKSSLTKVYALWCYFSVYTYLLASVRQALSYYFDKYTCALSPRGDFVCRYASSSNVCRRRAQIPSSSIGTVYTLRGRYVGCDCVRVLCVHM